MIATSVCTFALLESICYHASPFCKGTTTVHLGATHGESRRSDVNGKPWTLPGCTAPTPVVSNRNTSQFKISRNQNKTRQISNLNRNNNHHVAVDRSPRQASVRAKEFLIVTIVIRKQVQLAENKGRPRILIENFCGEFRGASSHATGIRPNCAVAQSARLPIRWGTRNGAPFAASVGLARRLLRGG